MNSLFKRRSIRKFKRGMKIDNDKVKIILKAGFSAPSARNLQSYNFLIIDEKELMNQISDIHPYAGMVKDASLAIMVMGDRNQQDNEGYIAQDCSAATENILIETVELDLGSVWLGLYPMEERIESMRTLLNIPEHFLPFSLIAIGYPDEYKEPNDRYIDDKVFYNKFK